MPAGQVYDGRANRLAGHLFGRMNGGQDSLLCRLHVNDHTGADTLAGLVADTGDADHAFFVRLADKAAYLARSDIECGYDASIRQNLSSLPKVGPWPVCHSSLVAAMGCGGRFFVHPHGHFVRHAEVHGRNVAFQKAVLAFQRAQLAPRVFRVIGG